MFCDPFSDVPLFYPNPGNIRKKSVWTTTVNRTWQILIAQLPTRCFPYVLYLCLINSDTNVTSFSSRNTFIFSSRFHKLQCCQANYFLNSTTWPLAYTTRWRTILKSTRIFRKIFPSRNWTHKSMEILQKVLLKLRGMSVLTFNLF